MARRTITFAEGVEEGIREVQIEMMRQEKRDVPFTEAVNRVILGGLCWRAQSRKMPVKELVDCLMQWARGMDKINVDAFLDNIPYFFSLP